LVERRHNYKVIYESDPLNPAEEFADIPRDIDESIAVPEVLLKKTHTNPKSNLKMAKVLKSGFRRLGKYSRTK